MIQKQFFEFHLEDKVNVWAGQCESQINFIYSKRKDMGKTQACGLKCNYIIIGFMILLRGVWESGYKQHVGCVRGID